MKNLSVATFHVRGLYDEVKKVNLSNNKVDVCCFQEAKVMQRYGKPINDYCLICIETNQKDYGNGYLYTKAWNGIYIKYGLKKIEY